MKTVLLSGAGGFVGRTAIQPLLDRNFEVHAITSKSFEQSNPNLYSHRVDLLDEIATERLIREIRPSHLLHFAWYVEHNKLWEAKENLKWLRASSSLFRSFVNNGGNRVVVSGTCAEYDWSHASDDLSEISSPTRPTTLYGQSKHELLIDLTSYSKSVRMSFAWGRLFFLFGPFESEARFVPYIIRSLLKGQVAECMFPDHVRDLMFVEEAGRAFVELLDSKIQGPVNIASGEPRRLEDIARSIARLLDRENLLKLGSYAASEREPQRLTADVTRLRKELNFSEKSDLTVNLNETITWWRDRITK